MLTLNDGRNELWQWDTGRTLSVDAECSQVHFGRNVYGRSIDVDVVDGIAKVPDILLQVDKPITAWAFVGTPGNGYTKISKEFVVNKRNKPADYVFTQEEQIALRDVIKRLKDVEENQNPEAIAKIVNDYLEENPVESPVQSVNGKTGKVHLNAEDVGALPKSTEIPKEYMLPLAASDTLGGIKAEPATEADIQPVRIGADGKLYIAPGGGGAAQNRLLSELEITESVSSITFGFPEIKNRVLVEVDTRRCAEFSGKATYIAFGDMDGIYPQPFNSAKNGNVYYALAEIFAPGVIKMTTWGGDSKYGGCDTYSTLLWDVGEVSSFRISQYSDSPADLNGAVLRAYGG